jgi:hypothetical protein
MERLAFFSAWDSFYVIIGSSAAALTGLQFVVMTLISTEEAHAQGPEVRAFGSPTVVHFCAALMIAAISTAPWRALSSAAMALGLCGIGGLAYAAVTVRRARTQMHYRPVASDWIWHAVLPAAAYSALLLASIALPRDPAGSLFFVAGAALSLVLIGIHNAWDTVTYIAIDKPD